MLNKLLKYDLKHMIKSMGLFYILAVLFAVITRVIYSFEQTVMLRIIGSISVSCMFSLAASVLINTVMRSWIRFRNSVYRDESYLTHTLPVTKKAIYDSKFIQTLLFCLLGFSVTVLCLFITYYTEERWQALTRLLGGISAGLGVDAGLLTAVFLSVVFLEMFNAVQCGFFGMILGYKQNSGKAGYSVLFGAAAYLLSQSAVLMSVFAVGLFDNGIMELFKSNALPGSGSLKVLFISAVVVYILIIAAMNLLCKKLLGKGVDVE